MDIKSLHFAETVFKDGVGSDPAKLLEAVKGDVGNISSRVQSRIRSRICGVEL